MERCGDPRTLTVKRRVTEAVLAGEPPTEVASDRHGRAGIRIALRQMKAGGQGSETLIAWLGHFDQGSPDDGDDAATLHHDG